MAIPDKPLEVQTDLRRMTLGEMKLFSRDGFDVAQFSAFLERHTNWTAAEIDAIEMGELEAVAQQLGDALKRRAIPLPS